MPVALTADAERRAGVALVTVRVRNPTPVARRVAVANRLPGPVLPPRRNGVPEVGWDDDGATAVVDAGDSVALGYACPVGGRDLVDPPAELAGVDDPDDPDGRDRREDPVARARRDLGGFRPPRDAVPAGGSAGSGTGSTDEEGPAGSDPDPAAATPETSLPTAVTEYLDGVSARVDLAERLTDASVPGATDALADCDVAPATLAEAVEGDAEALRFLSERADALAARAEAADVPADALRRLA